MRIHATCNTVAAAAVFFVLSCFTSLGNANLHESSLASVRQSYARLNAQVVDAADALLSLSDSAAPKGCHGRNSQAARDV